ncbi:ribonuclease activity regulator RraA [Paucibacter sp. M5-1]|uniref:ribonuclease activity regulator RraA n=1 Tax=Paucibacter sp. M5-1 TaxID=3015998 RepID=UPI0022B889D8|nr:ribonuclease activity regulator RraA [Paucibacter sp. M5-1]MCZ7883457.1 ribonuclease activity regulator RraA [Paucibacter sp. M5-1]
MSTPHESALDPKTHARLLAASTATLTTVMFKRGFRNVFMQNVHPLNPASARFVAPAFTLRYIPAREDLDPLNAFEDRAHPQRVAVEECPAGHVLVMDSRGDAQAASSGNLLVTRLMKRGCAAVITDGGFRDSPEIAALPFPAYHQRASAPTNLIRHHAVDLQRPIACGGVSVYPGDVLMGDAEGVVVIPRHLADAVAEEAYRQTMYEDWVNERIIAGDGLFGLYPLLDEDKKTAYAAWTLAQQSRYPHL